MTWDSWVPPAERDAEQRAAAEAAQRRAMTHFERNLLDVLGGIAETLKTHPRATSTCPDCGAEQPIGTSVAAMGAAASSEPVDRADPGSERPVQDIELPDFQDPDIT